MQGRIFVTIVVGFIAFGFVGTNLAEDKQKSDCPPPFQTFDIHAFTEAEAILLWPTGADAYATQEDAALDFPDRSLEAFFWSNLVQKAGALAGLEASDRNGDGLLCVKYTLAEHGSLARSQPDYDPLYVFLILDQGQ